MIANAYLKIIAENLINVEKMKEYNITIYEVVLLCLLLEKHPSISGLVKNNLIKKDFINTQTGELVPIKSSLMYPEHMYNIVPENENHLKEILSDLFVGGNPLLNEKGKDKEKTKSGRTRKELTKLAKDFIAIFPKGKKQGTNYSFRTSPAQISERLTKFFLKFGDFPDEDILTATKRYVDYFESTGDLTHMRLAKYFIFKNDREKGLESQLYEELINLDEDMEDVSNDTYTEMAYNINK